MDRQAFDKRIEFDINLIAYTGDDAWVEKTLFKIKDCLEGNSVPESGVHSDWCAYSHARSLLEN